ncbi:hypothetical protein CROQUDRAFT_86603 [Cronartium quercuum f. sp. fusiforme G11]|uniref:Uncharacterized protein n=1 Tax=Cronartium quercuum f. sp. fusiforme G11 TaxID=708437 RepID=A0A9P6NWB0_9BASI|nr:hypothetical protein CROQUDRAFT_86603 [Cronartium quercuum f. sp. fusiforme G11]
MKYHGIRSGWSWTRLESIQFPFSRLHRPTHSKSLKPRPHKPQCSSENSEEGARRRHAPNIARRRHLAATEFVSFTDPVWFRPFGYFFDVSLRGVVGGLCTTLSNRLKLGFDMTEPYGGFSPHDPSASRYARPCGTTGTSQRTGRESEEKREERDLPVCSYTPKLCSMAA